MVAIKEREREAHIQPLEILAPDELKTGDRFLPL